MNIVAPSKELIEKFPFLEYVAINKIISIFEKTTVEEFDFYIRDVDYLIISHLPEDAYCATDEKGILNFFLTQYIYNISNYRIIDLKTNRLVDYKIKLELK